MRESRHCTSVAILGCGVVGFSWAVVFARHGIQARLFNRPSPSLSTVKDRVRKALELLRDEGLIDGRAVSESMDRVLVFDDLAEAVSGADYVQEVLPEDLGLKQTTFARVAAMTSADVVIASSCSGLRCADIVSRVEHHPERCLVVHPANPPHLIPFVEISGDGASDEAKQAAWRLMEAVGQRPVLCKEIYGYVLNRLQLALIQQALWLVQHDICSVPAVEAALTDGLGLRWAFTGPFGLEELNSASLGEGLVKYREYMLEGFAELGEVREVDEAFVARAVDEFTPLLQGRDHDQYLAWRDRLLMRLAGLKAGAAD
jgi:3-hydroxyacyl-CoA dehydrogenase